MNLSKIICTDGTIHCEVNSLYRMPGVGERGLLQVVDACRAVLPDATVEEAVAAAAAVEKEQRD